MKPRSRSLVVMLMTEAGVLAAAGAAAALLVAFAMTRALEAALKYERSQGHGEVRLGGWRSEKPIS